MQTDLFVKTLLSCFVLNAIADKDENVLELVHVFFRHGSRSPDKSETCPTDPFAVDNFRPLGYGQLTNAGKERAYQLGRILREKYGSYLGDTYFPEMVSTKTTDYVRTQMSALLVLAGLFPPSGSQKWSTDLNWMPIPYSYEKLSRDYELRRPPLYCPMLQKDIEKVLKSEGAQKILIDHEQALSYMSQHCGKKFNRLFDAFSLYQTLYSEEKMNLTLPAWTKPLYPNTLHYLAMKTLYYENFSELSKRLNGGRMLKKVINNMIAKTKGLLKPAETKMLLYSGHEVNIVSILGALNLFEMKFPDYSSALLIELYRNSVSKQYAVKVLYVRDVYKQPDELTIHGCSSFCPLGQFIEGVQQYLPNNYTEECGSLVPLD